MKSLVELAKRRFVRSLSLTLVALWSVSALTGCATHTDRLVESRIEFYQGDLAAALASIDQSIEESEGEADVFLLDKAVVKLTAGEPAEAEEILRQVRDQFDYLQQPDLAEEALSMVTDEQRRSYSGEDYEKVLLRAYLAMSNLMQDGSDAGAYALQINEAQQEIIQAAATDDDEPNPKINYRQVGLGPYLYGLLREETHANYDDAVRSYNQVASWSPEFQSIQQDIQRAQFGHHSEKGNGALYVFAFVGRGPYKEEVLEKPLSAALLVADRILSATGEHTLPPTIAPIKVPRIVVPYNEIDRLFVSVDGAPAGETQTITNIGRLALEQQEVTYNGMVGRAVARRVIKKALVYSAKEAIGETNQFVNFAIDAAGVAWEATEAADTRCWGVLPEKIQVVRLELPAGQHRLSLQAASGKSPLGSSEEVVVEIRDGRNSYLMANFPDENSVGEILTSN